MPRCWYCNVSENNSTKRGATLYIQLDFYIQLVAGGGGIRSNQAHPPTLASPTSKFQFFFFFKQHRTKRGALEF